MTLNEMEVALNTELAHPDGIATDFYTSAEKKRWLNDGYKKFCRLSEALQDYFEITTQAGEGDEITLPYDHVRFNQVLWRQSDYEQELEVVHTTVIDRGRGTGLPEKYYIRNVNVLGVYPVNAVAGQLCVDYAHIPLDLADSDEPYLAEDFHIGIVFYAAYRACLKFRDYTGAANYHRLFMESAAEGRNQAYSTHPATHFQPRNYRGEFKY
jgi:hypothetical protein